MPDASQDELEKAQENLDEFVHVLYRIFQRQEREECFDTPEKKRGE